MKFSKKHKSRKNNKSKNNINMYKTLKNRTNRTNKKIKKNKTNIFKRGGSNPQDKIDVKEMTKEIGRVPFSRLERQIREQIEYLKKIRNNCAASCKTESCLYNNKENCAILDEMMKKENDANIGKYCAKKFQNLSCKKMETIHKKINFYLNYIETVNTNCRNLMNDYEKGSQFKDNEKLFE
jgi:hypothetical protein